jgi:hypothetical protein
MDAFLRIIVCGGRDLSDGELVFRVLDAAEDKAPHPLFIIEGGQRQKDQAGIIIGGADYWAWRWAVDRGRPCLTFPANWTAFGKGAGPLRNQQMLDEGKPVGVIAFRGGTGTADMVTRAKAAGLPVVAGHGVGSLIAIFDRLKGQ